MEENNNILKDIVMRTMDSVDNLAVQVAELNTTLKDGVINDISTLKQRCNRHRDELNDKEKRLRDLESHEKYVIGLLGLLGTVITAIVVPIVIAMLWGENMKDLIQNIDVETVLVILFLGIALLASIVLAMENIASVIVGALAGYLTRLVKDNIKRSD